MSRRQFDIQLESLHQAWAGVPRPRLGRLGEGKETPDKDMEEGRLFLRQLTCFLLEVPWIIVCQVHFDGTC